MLFDAVTAVFDDDPGSQDPELLYILDSRPHLREKAERDGHWVGRLALPALYAADQAGIVDREGFLDDKEAGSGVYFFVAKTDRAHAVRVIRPYHLPLTKDVIEGLEWEKETAARYKVLMDGVGRKTRKNI